MPETPGVKPAKATQPKAERPNDEPKPVDESVPPQGGAQVMGAEHVVGTHPDRDMSPGYHDSLSGRPVDRSGYFTDGQDDGPVPPDRIVADDWPDHEKHTKESAREKHTKGASSKDSDTK